MVDIGQECPELVERSGQFSDPGIKDLLLHYLVIRAAALQDAVPSRTNYQIFHRIRLSVEALKRFEQRVLARRCRRNHMKKQTQHVCPL